MTIRMIHPGQRQTHPRRGRRSGGAVLETVLVMPVLLYLAFGIVEFGYYFYVKHSLEGAARDFRIGCEC